MVPVKEVEATVNYEKTVTYTAISGTKGSSDSENCDKLFDGKYTQNDSTKWCANLNGSAYVIFQSSEPIIVNGYSFVIGNDNEDYSGRNPNKWTLYGCNNAQTNNDSWGLGNHT